MLSAEKSSSLSTQIAIQKQLPRIVSLELILTDACNLKCTYCFEHGATNRQFMNLATALSAVEFIVDASRDSDWIGITFMGGEPMLCYEMITQVVRHAKTITRNTNKKLYFDMTTNGVLLEERHLQYFREEGVRYCLSLDGHGDYNDRHRKMSSGEGIFGIIADKMKLFKKHQNWQGARMTVMPDTAIYLCDNIRYLHEKMAINQFVIGFATNVVWTDRQMANYNQGLKMAFEYYLEQRIKAKSRRLRINLLDVGEISDGHQKKGECGWGCGAGNGRLAVSPDGLYHGCSKMAWGRSGCMGAPVPLGSVNTGISQWQNRLKLLDYSDDVRKKCGSCEIKAFCNGGCYAVNYAETGDIYYPSDTYCKLICAQKNACDYARNRLTSLGLGHL